MCDNLGVQAANMVDEKIREYRTLQEELNTHRSDMGTLMAQRNENELVKQVRRVAGDDSDPGGLLLYCLLLQMTMTLYLACGFDFGIVRFSAVLFIDSLPIYRNLHPFLFAFNPPPHDRNWIYAIKKHPTGLTLSYINRLVQS